MRKTFFQKIKSYMGDISKKLQNQFQETFQFMLDNFIGDYFLDVHRFKIQHLIQGIPDAKINQDYFNNMFGMGLFTLVNSNIKLVKIDLPAMKLKLSEINLEIQLCTKVSRNEYLKYLKLAKKAKDKEIKKIDDLNKLREKIFGQQPQQENDEQNDDENMQTIWSIFETYLSKSAFVIDKLHIKLSMDVEDVQQDIIISINQIQAQITKVGPELLAICSISEVKLTCGSHDIMMIGWMKTISLLQFDERFQLTSPPIINICVPRICIEVDPSDANFFLGLHKVYEQNSQYLRDLNDEFQTPSPLKKQTYQDENELTRTSLNLTIFEKSSIFQYQKPSDEQLKWTQILDEEQIENQQMRGIVESLKKLKRNNNVIIETIKVTILIDPQEQRIGQFSVSKGRFNEKIMDNHILINIKSLKFESSVQDTLAGITGIQIYQVKRSLFEMNINKLKQQKQLIESSIHEIDLNSDQELAPPQFQEPTSALLKSIFIETDKIFVDDNDDNDDNNELFLSCVDIVNDLDSNYSGIQDKQQQQEQQDLQEQDNTPRFQFIAFLILQIGQQKQIHYPLLKIAKYHDIIVDYFGVSLAHDHQAISVEDNGNQMKVNISQISVQCQYTLLADLMHMMDQIQLVKKEKQVGQVYPLQISFQPILINHNYSTSPMKYIQDESLKRLFTLSTFRLSIQGLKIKSFSRQDDSDDIIKMVPQYISTIQCITFNCLKLDYIDCIATETSIILIEKYKNTEVLILNCTRQSMDDNSAPKQIFSHAGKPRKMSQQEIQSDEQKHKFHKAFLKKFPELVHQSTRFPNQLRGTIPKVMVNISFLQKVQIEGILEEITRLGKLTSKVEELEKSQVIQHCYFEISEVEIKNYFQGQVVMKTLLQGVYLVNIQYNDLKFSSVLIEAVCITDEVCKIPYYGKPKEKGEAFNKQCQQTHMSQLSSRIMVYGGKQVINNERKYINPFSITDKITKLPFCINISQQSVGNKIITFANIFKLSIRVPDFSFALIKILIEISSQIPQQQPVDPMILNDQSTKLEMQDILIDVFPTYNLGLLKDLQFSQIRRESSSKQNIEEQSQAFYSVTRSVLLIHKVCLSVYQDRTMVVILNQLDYYLQRTSGALLEMLNPQLFISEPINLENIFKVSSMRISIDSNSNDIYIQKISSRLTYDKIESLINHAGLVQAQLERAFPTEIELQQQYRGPMRYKYQFGPSLDQRNCMLMKPFSVQERVYQHTKVLVFIEDIDICFLSGLTYQDVDIFQYKPLNDRTDIHMNTKIENYKQPKKSIEPCANCFSIAVQKLELVFQQFSNKETLTFVALNLQDLKVFDEVSESRYAIILGKELQHASQKPFLSMALTMQSNQQTIVDLELALQPIRVCISGYMLESILMFSNYCCPLDNPVSNKDFYEDDPDDFLICMPQSNAADVPVTLNSFHIDQTFIVLSYDGRGILTQGSLKGCLRIASINNLSLSFQEMILKSQYFKNNQDMVAFLTEELQKQFGSSRQLIIKSLGSLFILSPITQLSKGIISLITSPLQKGIIKGLYSGFRDLSKGVTSSLLNLADIPSNTALTISEKFNWNWISQKLSNVNLQRQAFYNHLNPAEEVPKEFLKQKQMK